MNGERQCSLMGCSVPWTLCGGLESGMVSYVSASQM
jgi:hypothetical protein